MQLSFLDMVASAALGVGIFLALANGVREYFLTKTGPLFMALLSIALWLFLVALPLIIDAPDAFKVVSAVLIVLPVVTLIGVLLFRQKNVETLKGAAGALLCCCGGLFVLWRMGCMFGPVCL
jgi:hypothetical protein